MNFIQLTVIFIAAFTAGMINSVAGGGTLVSFPALIWVGVDPIIANATNTIAVWPGSVAAMAGYREELKGSRKWILLLMWPSLIGGAAGAYLLLKTPVKTFSDIVPFLILGATLLIALQEPITRLFGLDAGEKKTHHWYAGAIFFQLLVAIYGGYFGAGIGILMLAALGLLGHTDIHHMNGMKTFFGSCINGIAAIYFAVSGAVYWPAGLLMAAGAILGGYGGAGLAKKLGRKFVRRAVIIIGLGMAVSLFIKGLIDQGRF